MFAFSGPRRMTKENYEWELGSRQPGETYLGDGIYASFDGNTIKLRSPQQGDIELYIGRADAKAIRHFMAQCFGVEDVTP